MDLSSFYAGSMAAPDKGPNGTLVQSRRAPPPSSISDLYDGMYSEVGGAPAKRTVQTTRVTPSYADANRNDTIVDRPAAPPVTSSYSTLDTIAPLDINRLGLTSSPFATPAVNAIASATSGGADPIGAGPLSYGSLLGLLFDPAYSGSVGAQPMNWESSPVGPAPAGDPWATSDGGDLRLPSGAGKAPKAKAPKAAPTSSPISQTFSGGHDTSSPDAFAASVTRPSTMPGVKQFTGKVEQGQMGQNRYGSTARNELTALFG